MKKSSSTLQDVATQAGVSTATVSRCLNHPDKVRIEVRENVKKAISTLNYVPHGAARALASKRTYTIGAIVPTIDNSIFSEAIRNLQHTLTAANYTLLIANSAYSLEQELKEVESLISRGIDGLVLVGENHHPNVFKAIELHRISYISLWIYNRKSKYSCVGFDNIKAGKNITQHLLDLGHKKIAVISALLENNDRVQQRLKGIRSTLKTADEEFTDDCLIECRYSVEQGRQAIHSLLDANPQITAIICSNDILALGALWGARQRKIKVPKMLSITGFDNMEMIPALSPALTTVNSPSKRMGVLAAEYLLKQINSNQTKIKRIEIEAELIVRETTGPAAI